MEACATPATDPSTVSLPPMKTPAAGHSLPKGEGCLLQWAISAAGAKGKDLRCTHHFLSGLGRSPLELSPAPFDRAFWMICKSVAALAAWKV